MTIFIQASNSKPNLAVSFSVDFIPGMMISILISINGFICICLILTLSQCWDLRLTGIIGVLNNWTLRRAPKAFSPQGSICRYGPYNWTKQGTRNQKPEWAGFFLNRNPFLNPEPLLYPESGTAPGTIEESDNEPGRDPGKELVGNFQEGVKGSYDLWVTRGPFHLPSQFLLLYSLFTVAAWFLPKPFPLYLNPQLHPRTLRWKWRRS